MQNGQAGDLTVHAQRHVTKEARQDNDHAVVPNMVAKQPVQGLHRRVLTVMSV